MAEFTDWESLDTELPPPVECETVVRTSAGDILLSDIGGGGGGLPEDQEWTEISRETTPQTFPDGGCDIFSIIIEQADSITFAMGTKTLKLNLAGW